MIFVGVLLAMANTGMGAPKIGETTGRDRTTYLRKVVEPSRPKLSCLNRSMSLVLILRVVLNSALAAVVRTWPG